MAVDKRFFVLKKTGSSANGFVKYWSALYDYPNPHIYEEVIRTPVFKKTTIKKLYAWKNNMGVGEPKFSGTKEAFISKVLKKIPTINKLRGIIDEYQYKKDFFDLPAVWGILLLHVMNPGYPLYDQHVHRAFKYLHNGVHQEIPTNDKQKYKVYFEQYVPYFTGLVKVSRRPGTEVDDALWTFGRFLSNRKKTSGFDKLFIL